MVVESADKKRGPVICSKGLDESDPSSSPMECQRRHATLAGMWSESSGYIECCFRY
jgi:hypothetical protein